MSNEVYAFALDNALKEVKSVCPDLANTFIFDDNCLIVAKDPETAQEAVGKIIDEFRSIKEKAQAIDGLEKVTVQGSEGRVQITRIDNFYLATTYSKEVDEKFIGALYRVLIPTVVKVVDQLQPAMSNDVTHEPAILKLSQEEIEQTYTQEVLNETQEFAPEEVEPENVEGAPTETEYSEAQNEALESSNMEESTNIEEPIDAEQAEPIEEEQATESEGLEEIGPVLPEAPVTQVIVESIGGLLVKSDTVRIDNSIISRWNDLYGDKKIEEVDLEALDGKTTRCKFKPIKDSKYEGKGVIQMPEKIQLSLETSKGELVMVKPVVE
jgi:hypothetical protein